MGEPSEEVEELIDAARYGDYEDVSAALDNKTPVNGTDALGRTGTVASGRSHARVPSVCSVLEVACMHVHLADAGVGLPTALHMACANGHAGIVHLLISAGAVSMHVMRRCVVASALHHASSSDVQCFCAQDVALANAEGNVPLHWACLNGHVEVRHLALVFAHSLWASTRQSVDSSHIACVQIVKLLLEAGGSPSALNRWTQVRRVKSRLQCHL